MEGSESDFSSVQSSFFDGTRDGNQEWVDGLHRLFECSETNSKMSQNGDDGTDAAMPQADQNQILNQAQAGAAAQQGARYKKYPELKLPSKGPQEITGEDWTDADGVKFSKKDTWERIRKIVAVDAGLTRWGRVWPLVEAQATEPVFGTTPTPVVNLEFHEELAAELIKKCSGRAGDLVEAAIRRDAAWNSPAGIIRVLDMETGLNGQIERHEEIKMFFMESYEQAKLRLPGKFKTMQDFANYKSQVLNRLWPFDKEEVLSQATFPVVHEWEETEVAKVFSAGKAEKGDALEHCVAQLTELEKIRENRRGESNVRAQANQVAVAQANQAAGGRNAQGANKKDLKNAVALIMQTKGPGGKGGRGGNWQGGQVNNTNNVRKPWDKKGDRPQRDPNRCDACNMSFPWPEGCGHTNHWAAHCPWKTGNKGPGQSVGKEWAKRGYNCAPWDGCTAIPQPSQVFGQKPKGKGKKGKNGGK